MKKISKILSYCFLVCIFSVVFAACTEDPYKDYVSSGLEPKTKIGELSEDEERWFATEQKEVLLTSYEDYKDFGIDLGYTEAYFELNHLLLFLRTGCSSDNLKFVNILEKDGVLYPVLETNFYKEKEPTTDDIIFYIFYSEIPIEGNYSIGKVITQTRQHKVVW